jgi:DNA-binding MurR/RpiR family transcriptional regulator
MCFSLVKFVFIMVGSYMQHEQPKQQPPRVFRQLKSWLQEHHSTLPKRLQSVAVYAVSHPDMMALNTIAVISEQIGVTPSTLVRFAKHLGYKGFSDMQSVFQESMRHISQPYSERIHSLDEQIPQKITALQRFATAASRAIEKLSQTEAQLLLQASHKLADANVVYIAGQGRAAPVSVYLHYMLVKMGMQTVILEGTPSMLVDKAKLMSASELLLAISFSSYAANTRELVDICIEQQVPVISITDSTLSPIARRDAICLEVIEHEVAGFRGLSATMCLAQCLAVEAGKCRANMNS